MKPFLRRSNRAEFATVGWASEPVGMWAGRQFEVVFDRRRHVIVMMRSDPGDAIRALLTAEGFQRLAVDGQQEMWTGDRNPAVERGHAGQPAAMSSLVGSEECPTVVGCSHACRGDFEEVSAAVGQLRA
ncbi:MAG: hypothetical protein AMXMBFR46_25760 [Acidimicrobiia bacterium]